MSNTVVAVGTFVSSEVHEALTRIAKKNKRSLTREIEWVLERYVRSQEDDGA